MSSQYRLHLHSNGYYYHRVKVPADIRLLYGKQIVQISLRTRDFRDAVRRLPAVIVEVDRQFSQFRNDTADTFGALSCLDHNLLPPVVARKNAPGIASFHLVETIRGLVRAEMTLINDGSDQFLAVSNSATPTENRSLPMMSDIAIECFEAVARQKNWSAKTSASRRTQINQVIDICGDKPLNEYTQRDVRLLKTVLFALPPQSQGQKRFYGLSKVEIADAAKKLGLPGLSAESVRQIMTAMNIVFGWARAEYDNTLQNIVQPMIPSPSSGGNKKDKRDAFSIDELQQLFKCPVFSTVKSVKTWHEPGEVTMQHTGRFWVPLLALFAGARLMEAVQLVREDIGCEGDVWFIDINDDDEERTGKRVKNDASLRRIPLHATLVELGFVEFVKTVSDGTRLFPDIPIGPPTQRHRFASKMFNNLLIKAGIKGPKKVWHSLRHSFEQACRDSRVDSAIMDQLQGHSQKGMRGVYGAGYGLPSLREGVRSIAYGKLDLSFVQPFKSSPLGDETPHGG